MKRQMFIYPVEKKEIEKKKYDIFITTLGYESRARYIAENISIDSRYMYATAFTHRHILDYEENKRFFTDNSYEVKEIQDDIFKDWFQNILQQHLIELAQGEKLKILVDISSMSRIRIAAVVASAKNIEGKNDIVVDFIYAFAKYTEPSKSIGPIINSGPIIHEYSGWTASPSDPIITIFGLGYEYDKAIGIIENLEPKEIWAFLPHGHNQKFDKAIKKANDGLWEILKESNIIKYDIYAPYKTLILLESMIYGMNKNGRLIIIPFGPKFFSLLSLLVATIYENISVWRVSAERFGEVTNQIATGKLISLNVEFRKALEDR